MITIFSIKPKIWMLALLIVFGIDVFGAVHLTDLPSVSMAGFGSLLIHDLLLLFFLGFMFAKLRAVKDRFARSSITYPLITFLLLTFVEICLSFARGVPPHLLMYHARPYVYYLLYFLVLCFINTEDELIQFIKLIVAIAVITASVTCYQAITGHLILSENKRFQSAYGLYQSLNSGEVLMPCAFLILFSWLIGKKRSSKNFLIVLILLTWIGTGIFFLLVRSVWGSLFLAVCMIVIVNKSQTIKTMVVLALFSISIVVAFSVIKQFYESTSLSHIIKDRVDTATYHTESRNIFMRSRISYLLDNPSLFGCGFKSTLGARGVRYDPTFITNHNVLADLAAGYGFSGFIVFGWLILAVLRHGVRVYRALPDSWQKSVALSLLAFNIQVLIFGYASNSYFVLSGIIVLAPSWAMLAVIERLYKQKQVQALTCRTF